MAFHLARRSVRLAIVTAVLVGAACMLTAATPAAQASTSDELTMFSLTNQSRAENGLAPLTLDPAASTVARAWSSTMASTGNFMHNPDLVAAISGQVTTAWKRIGENIGVGGEPAVLQPMFMNSPGHRANILGDYNRVGIGSVRDGSGTLWITLDFVSGPTLAPSASAPPPPPPSHPVAWYLREANSYGGANYGLTYGMSDYQQFVGDWDGNGSDTVGVYSNGTWFLRNSLTAGKPDVVISYGYPGAIPVVGDWDGNGTDTIGVYDKGMWLLRNTNSGGAPHLVTSYGYAGAAPVVGDWDANGSDTIGVYDSGMWLLRNNFGTGAPHLAASYGYGGTVPVVGDWDGNGTDTIGVFDKGMWYLRNTISGGAPHIAVNYGAAGYRPVPGDWTGNGTDTIGVAV